MTRFIMNWRGTCNFSRQDVELVCGAKGFWKDVINTWSDYNFHCVNEIDEILNQRIWLNSHIRIGSKLAYIQSLAEKGIFTVLDIINPERGRFYQLNEINEKYCTNVTWYEYQQFISAIPKEWKRKLLQISQYYDIDYTTKIEQIIATERPSLFIIGL